MQEPHRTESRREYDPSIFLYNNKENLRHWTLIKARNPKFEQEQTIKNIPTLATEVTKNTELII